MTSAVQRGGRKSAIRTSLTQELQLQVAIKSVQSEVTNVVSRITGWLNSHSLAANVVGELELVLAEALNNVVEHAYMYVEEGEIEIIVVLTGESLRTRITDSGRKFDGPPPFKDLDIDNCDFEELPEGGFGWNLIRTLTDEVEFEHKNDQNRLTLTRNLRVKETDLAEL
jgi:serine/threonine-protein kinase RsbW